MSDAQGFQPPNNWWNINPAYPVSTDFNKSNAQRYADAYVRGLIDQQLTVLNKEQQSSSEASNTTTSSSPAQPSGFQPTFSSSASSSSSLPESFDDFLKQNYGTYLNRPDITDDQKQKVLEGALAEWRTIGPISQKRFDYEQTKTNDLLDRISRQTKELLESNSVSAANRYYRELPGNMTKYALEAMGKMGQMPAFTPTNVQLATNSQPITVATANSILARTSPGQNQNVIKQA